MKQVVKEIKGFKVVEVEDKQLPYKIMDWSNNFYGGLWYTIESAEKYILNHLCEEAQALQAKNKEVALELAKVIQDEVQKLKDGVDNPSLDIDIYGTIGSWEDNSPNAAGILISVFKAGDCPRSNVLISSEDESIDLPKLIDAGLNLQESKKIASVLSEFLGKGISLTYEGKELYCFDSGKEI